MRDIAIRKQSKSHTLQIHIVFVSPNMTPSPSHLLLEPVYKEGGLF